MSALVRGMTSLSGRDPEGYQPHLLHSSQRTYPETNCYADVLIELLHGCGYEPLALFAHLVRLDFEGDQWTFFKPPAEDLENLFGVDIHEMQPYRPLPVQAGELLAVGRTLIVELDSWYLPDTHATSYRTGHVKTSCAIDAVDPETETLRYFHNGGLHELTGEDYRGVFRIGDFSGDVLPPYTELVRFDLGPALTGDELREASRATLAAHLRRAPTDDPFARWGTRLTADLPDLLAGDMAAYHDYAFATARMVGAGFDTLAAYTDWLMGETGGEISTALGELVAAAKAFSFRLARRRAFDPEPLLGTMATAWERAMTGLAQAAG